MLEIKENYEDYLNSYSWKAIKKTKLEETPKCEVCGFKATTVHHLSYERLGKEKEDDIVSVCDDCHKKCHFVDGYQIKSSEINLKKRFEELKEENSLYFEPNETICEGYNLLNPGKKGYGCGNIIYDGNHLCDKCLNDVNSFYEGVKNDARMFDD